MDIENSCCDVELISDYINSNPTDVSSKIIIYTGSTNDSIVEKAAKLGIQGYLPKCVVLHEIVKAIDIVHNNGTLLDPTFATQLLKHLRVAEQSQLDSDALSKREREVLSLIAAGASNRHIADKLFNTV